MRSEIRQIRKPLTDDELESVATTKIRGGKIEGMLHKISLKDVPIEERHKEARKPLYLVRYE
jgi:hypothetical protein